MIMKLKCTYTGGSGIEHDAGIWEKKETPKTITLTLSEEPFFEPNYNICLLYTSPSPRDS